MGGTKMNYFDTTEGIAEVERIQELTKEEIESILALDEKEE
jgi:hypothetical protein